MTTLALWISRLLSGSKEALLNGREYQVIQNESVQDCGLPLPLSEINGLCHPHVKQAPVIVDGSHHRINEVLYIDPSITEVQSEEGFISPP